MNAKTILLTATMTMTAAVAVQAQTLFFDFGDPAQQTTGNYNNILIANGSVANAIDNTGATTGISLSTSGFNPGSNLNGTTAPSGAASIFDPQATRDNFFGHALGVFNQPTILPLGMLTFTGLNPLATYDFTFFASRTGVSDNRETKYEAVGLNSGFSTLDAANNIANVATVSGISPNAQGNLTVNVTMGPNNNNTTGFFYLGAMQVVVNPVPEPSSFALAALGGLALAFGRRHLRGKRD